MNLSGHCGGCGFGNQSCPIVRCSMEHGNPEYCFHCTEYPCKRYEHIDEHDFFITHRNQKTDMNKMQRIGEDAYNVEQAKKRQILDRLLGEYNDGRKKALFCLAVNLLNIEDAEKVLQEAGQLAPDLSARDKAKYVSERLAEIADKRGIELKLRKKTR